LNKPTLDEEYRIEVACEMAAILEDELPQLMFFSCKRSGIRMIFTAEASAMQSTQRTPSFLILSL